MMDCSHVAREKNRLIATAFCLESDTSCCICLQAMHMKPVIYLPCTHFLHTHCLKDTVKSGLYTCPLCRHDHTAAYMKVRFLTADIIKQKEIHRQTAQRLADERYVLTLLMGESESEQMLYLLMQPGMNAQLLSQMHVFWQDDEDEGDEGEGEETVDVVDDDDDDDGEVEDVRVLTAAADEDWPY